jgi:hypothetical protein
MAPQKAHAPAWPSMAEHEPIEIVPRLDPVHGMLIGLAVAAALWAAFGGGFWFVVRLPIS